jgi:hypothetical protein
VTSLAARTRHTVLFLSDHPGSFPPPPPGGARARGAPLPRPVVDGELLRRWEVEEAPGGLEGLRPRQRAPARGRLRLRARRAH